LLEVLEQMHQIMVLEEEVVLVLSVKWTVGQVEEMVVMV
jgi:hypothetical protein